VRWRYNAPCKDTIQIGTWRKTLAPGTGIEFDAGLCDTIEIWRGELLVEACLVCEVCEPADDQTEFALINAWASGRPDGEG